MFRNSVAITLKHGAADVSGMTIPQVMGCGSQHGWSERFCGTEALLNMVPKVKFELVVEGGTVNELVGPVCETGEVAIWALRTCGCKSSEPKGCEMTLRVRCGTADLHEKGGYLARFHAE